MQVVKKISSFIYFFGPTHTNTCFNSFLAIFTLQHVTAQCPTQLERAHLQQSTVSFQRHIKWVRAPFRSSFTRLAPQNGIKVKEKSSHLCRVVPER